METEMRQLADKTLLRCSLCGEDFREPRILKCLHSFCQECLAKQEDNESITCKRCEQECSVKAIQQNDFLRNTLAGLLLKELQDGGRKCGNCSNENCVLKYCIECRECLCENCIYCHENTKLTRGHHLISVDKHQEDLLLRGQRRVVFCPVHSDSVVEQYCRSCEETMCRECDVHQGHNAVGVAEGCSVEVPNLEAVLKKATFKVDSHEKCASRCCSLVDELRDRKSELCDRINDYFVKYKEKVREQEEQLMDKVLKWYNKQFELIKHAQKEEERRLEKIVDAVKFSQTLLKQGTDAEILSLKRLVQSQLNRVANQKTGTTLLASVEAAVRNASWDRKEMEENLTQEKKSSGLHLPEVHDDQESDVDNDDIPSVLLKPKVEAENKRNEARNILSQAKEIIPRRRGNSGVEGKDFHLGTVISREHSKIWNAGVVKDESRLMSRDYRYDKILRNRSIGRQGSGCGEFQHPCGIAVDYKRDDRLFVTDFNNNRVQVFTYFGEYLFQFGVRGSAPGQFNGPTGVAVLHDGLIVVCDCLNNRVQRFTSEGIFMSQFGTDGRGQGEFWRPMGIAVDNEGRIVVVDQGNNRVQVFDCDGEFQFTFGKLGNWDGEISCPNFVAIDKEDNIYVSDEVNMRIQIFRRDGSYMRKISAQEIHGFQGIVEHLSGIAVDSWGYVIVGVKNSCSVRVFTPDGRFLRSFSSTRVSSSRLLFASGIALTSAGEIVVSDWFHNRIRFF